MPLHSKEYLQELIARNIGQQAEIGEQELLQQLLKEPNAVELTELIRDHLAVHEKTVTHDPQQDFNYWEGLANNVLAADRSVTSLKNEHLTNPSLINHFSKAVWLRYAAVLLLVAGSVTFLYRINRPQQTITQKMSVPEISPGGNKAILTLADGSTIILDSAANGKLAEQGNTRILKLNAGSLAYNTVNTDPAKMTGQVFYNTISTPKGGQYQITLPDGSKVWLNAASSIKFPTTFIKDRKVTITGEVYMEIATDKQKPFLVTASQVQVEVLGTSFNINAYADEPSMKTTLLQGSVKLLKNGTSEILRPGQQAIVKDRIAVNHSVDVQQVIAWKNGLFNFEGATLDEFMRQVARWYDLKVVYHGAIPETTFQGKFDRNFQLSEIMEILTYFKIKYKREGRTIIIE